MTEGLREMSEEQKAARNPAFVSPPIVWIASAESKDFTGRIVEAGGGLLAISEGWHRGPTAPWMADPSQMGKVMYDLQSKARKNAGMNGMDLD
jgi:hypothetical protein